MPHLPCPETSLHILSSIYYSIQQALLLLVFVHAWPGFEEICKDSAIASTRVICVYVQAFMNLQIGAYSEVVTGPIDVNL